ncbi:hypothetical protein IAR55_002752 [Kwoniella newhampshirensis]|uniref:Ribosomal RNA-processing protein 8 n=1 Tax=Kwoniella newhampshirensis TaxID=1651941 RepID=A0AAW0YZS8_9TREE
MSLFPSAFDSSLPGPSKAISTTSLPGSKSHKRKRPSTSHDGKDDQLLRSTQANLERLMSKIEKGNLKEKDEGREGMGAGLSKKAKKKARQNEDREMEGGIGDTPRSKGRDGARSHDTQNPASAFKETPKSKDQKEQKKDKESKAVIRQSGSKKKLEPVELPFPTTTLVSPKGAVKVGGEGNLTEMQAKMQAKLEGARFRWINEQLYSTPSAEAVAMMKKDPKIFADYHETHRLLTSGWPSPPLPHIVKLLAPLPAGSVIADLGCGDAGLARALVPQGKVVLSYDLVGDSGVPGAEQAAKTAGGWVVEADFLEKVPLPGRPGGLDFTKSDEAREKEKKSGKKKGRGGRDNAASEVVDAVVCCLSLMGKNWVGGIFEACRVLKQGGALHVAEVTSRFISTDKFVEKVESFGFEVEEQDSPSSHFTLFRFTKTAEVPQGPARDQKGWTERVEEGEEILRGCVYKKR